VKQASGAVLLLESMNTFRFPELDEALRELVA
jgi:hypothetical protein